MGLLDSSYSRSVWKPEAPWSLDEKSGPFRQFELFVSGGTNNILGHMLILVSGQLRNPTCMEVVLLAQVKNFHLPSAASNQLSQQDF